MIIGLTGLYCAGKNHVGSLLEKRGLPILDLDMLGHEAIRCETAAIVSRFGEEILGKGGVIDRRLLGKRVFNKPEELAALEAIIHPVVNRQTREWIDSQLAIQTSSQDSFQEKNKICVINAALLHKSSVFNQLGAIIAVHAPLPVRFFRAARRDKLPLGELVKRFYSQRNFPRYRAGFTQSFSCSADIYIIQNTGCSSSGRTLEKRVDAILEGLNHGKEKITAGNSFSWSISGNRSKRGNPDH